MHKTIRELFEGHSGKLTDKWSFYLDEWERLFAPYRRQPLDLLEIGIQNGGSLEVWAAYFSRARKIVGCDLTPACASLQFSDPRIAVVVGDANTDDCQARIAAHAPAIDILIDDGSHMSADMVHSFARYFPLLRPGGIYVVEDMHASYWQDFQGGLHDPLSAMSFFKRLADVVNYEHWRVNQPSTAILEDYAREFEVHFDPFVLAGLHSVEFVNSLCILRKASPEQNVLGMRLVVGGQEPITTDHRKYHATSIHNIATTVKDDGDLDVFALIARREALLADAAGQEHKVRALMAQVSGLERQIEQISNRLAEQEQAARSLAEQLAQKEQAEQDLAAQVAEKERTVQAVHAQAEAESLELQRRLTYAEGSLRELQESLVVRLLNRYRLWIEKNLPYGSRRRRFYTLLVTGSRVLFSEGPVALFRRLRGRGRDLAAQIRTPPAALPPAALPSAALPSAALSQAAGAALAPALPVAPASARYLELYNHLQRVSNGETGAEYVPLAAGRAAPDHASLRLVAFYLPQYHPIPENDAWWGKGFTEWTNVSKSFPQFVGHHQPRLPGELGFYDLRLPQVQHRQVELARQYGIHGFCFYYYWFNGKRLLEGPLEQFASDPEIDFPFCLCWANENWTRRWDGMENDILIAQKHSRKSDHAFIHDILPLLRHRNYIRVNGRPVLIVYRADILPDPAGTAARWKEDCRAAGLEEPYLVAAQTFGFTDPRKVGFDAAVEFPPHNSHLQGINYATSVLNPDFQGSVFSYTEIVDQRAHLERPEYHLFRTVFPGWDNNPRKPGRGYTFAFATPDNYRHWLQQACRYTLQDPDPGQNLVFINAWNEWAEGAYLEPDRKYGYAFLQATADCLHELVHQPQAGSLPLNQAFQVQAAGKRHDTAVILHLFYPEMWQEILAYLENLQDGFDLYVTIPHGVDMPDETILARYPTAAIFRCENRGRDVAPFLGVFAAIYPLQYAYICKIHTKRSPHREDGDAWRQDMLNKLLGSGAPIGAVKRALDQYGSIGMLVPQDHLVSSLIYWGENAARVEQIARRLGIDYKGQEFVFPDGSMFWFRPQALFPLTMLPLTLEDFEPEKGQKDGTLAHVFERMFGLVAHFRGLKLLELAADGQIREPDLEALQKYAFAMQVEQKPALERVNRAPIIICQMGKVGSITLLHSLDRAYQELSLDIPIHHIHFINKLDSLEEIILERSNPTESLSHVKKARELRKQIDDNPDSYWKIISPVREPVARNVSLFFQNLFETIPDWQEHYRSGDMTLDDLRKLFFEDAAIHSAPEIFFDIQLKPVFGIDVYASPFPHANGYKTYWSKPRTPLLVIRLEDLDRVAAEAMHEFLALDGFEIVRANIGEDKDYAEVYRQFKALPLPREYVEKMYATRYARHFYTPEERQRFFHQWTGG